MSLLMRPYWFPLSGIRRGMGGLFEGMRPLAANVPESNFAPVRIRETDEEVTVDFELPGVSSEDIELTITGGSVALKAKRGVEGDIPPEKYYLRERWRGEFGRNVTVPGIVDSRKAKAVYTDGVLTVHIPKAEEARPRRVKVNA